VIDGREFGVQTLRKELLVQTPGDSVAYVTDFLLDASTHESLATWLLGCRTLVCESQYRHADLELAQKNSHATAKLVAELARDAKVTKLILFHLSDRYSVEEWKQIRDEVCEIFPDASFSTHWNL